MKELMLASEAAKYLRINYTTLCRLARQGKVPAVKVGGEWRFKKEVLDNLFKGLSPPKENRVLVVDDDARVRDILVDIAGAEGATIVAVGTGEKALAEIRRQAFDLVLLDLVLPDMSGINVLKEIKRHSPQTSVAIITGYGDDPIAAEALSLGPMILLRKPFAVQDVRQVLHLTAPRQEIQESVRT